MNKSFIIWGTGMNNKLINYVKINDLWRMNIRLNERVNTWTFLKIFIWLKKKEDSMIWMKL